MLELKNINYSINKTVILKDINLSFKKHHFNVLLGPNGAGKSTLLKIAAGVCPPSVGSIFLDGKNMSEYSTKNLSFKRAVLSQQFDITFPLRVKEVVMMGRYPHFDSTPSVVDLEIIESALNKVSMSHKTNQNYMTLSGGEKQKVQMARVLAQIWNTTADDSHKYLFLDEPTTSLDIRYQLQILDIAKKLLEFNTTVVAILHDLNMSFQYGNSFFFLKNGHLAYQTDNKGEISSDLIEDIYEVKARKLMNKEGLDAMWSFGLIQPTE